MTITCPTPSKSRYATREAAESSARRVQVGVGQILNPYTCACTWWHLTSKPAVHVPANATPDGIDVQRLQSLTDTDFRATVAADANGTAPMPDRLALRHHANLPRWRRMLAELQADLTDQYRRRSADTTEHTQQWRRRATGYREALSIRTNECRQLRAEAHTAAMEEAQHKAAQRKENQVQDEQNRIATASQKELRRMAGEVAIDRLIEAHGPEFSRLLAEECERIGAELPNRVRKYLEPASSEETAA